MATILFAGTAAHLRLLLRLTLHSGGHDVIEVADGDAALAALRAHRPAVAILGVEMPGRSGLAVCRAVRTEPDLADVRVLLVSASAIEVEAAMAGADACLTSSYSLADLLAVVEGLAVRTPEPPDVRPLRAWRAERLLLIRELARLAGVAPSTIYLAEAGCTTMHPLLMRRVAAAVGVDVHHIAEFRRAVDDRGLGSDERG